MRILLHCLFTWQASFSQSPQITTQQATVSVGPPSQPGQQIPVLANNDIQVASHRQLPNVQIPLQQQPLANVQQPTAMEVSPISQTSVPV